MTTPEMPLATLPRASRVSTWLVFGDSDTPEAGSVVPHDAYVFGFGEPDSLDEASYSDSDARHQAYLTRMVSDGVVPADVSEKARLVWNRARNLVPGLPVPIAVAYDGGPIHYTWDNGRHQATAEFHPGEMASDWFIRDRLSKTFDGTEFSSGLILPQALLDCLRNIVG